MRAISFISSCLAIGLAAACGSSSERVRTFDQKGYDEGYEVAPVLAPEERRDDDDDYFGPQTGILEDDRVHPVDRLEPRTDLLEPMDPGGVSQPPAGERVVPAPIGDVRLQAEGSEEEAPAKPGEQEPIDVPREQR